jgi:ATP-dependent exoDNAse (exonuclease V) beta subunit
LVAHTIPPRPRPSIEEEAGEDEGWSRPRAATSFGRAVHAVLQHLDPASPGDLVQLSRLAAVEEGCEQDAAHIAHLAAVALESAVVRRAVASGRCYRELPLSVSIEGGALEAVVDLCFEEDGQLVVVDYKTDALHSREEVAGAALGYRSQAGAYALALEAVCGRPVSAVVLLFLAVPGGPVEHVVEELPAAVADARRLADRALAPSAS